MQKTVKVPQLRFILNWWFFAVKCGILTRLNRLFEVSTQERDQRHTVD